MVTSAETRSTESVTAATWIGFAMMCVGMFMAVLDVQVVATSLPTIQQALDIPQDQMSWIQTAYLIAEIVTIPLTGFLMRTLTMRWMFVTAVSAFTLASIGCATSRSIRFLDRVAHCARVLWRYVDSSCIFRGLFAFSSPPPGSGDCDCGRPGRSCADAGAGRRWLDHVNLFLALALPNQCRTGNYSRRSWRGYHCRKAELLSISFVMST